MTDPATPTVPYTTSRQVWLGWAGLVRPQEAQRVMRISREPEENACRTAPRHRGLLRIFACYRRKCMTESSAGL